MPADDHRLAALLGQRDARGRLPLRPGPTLARQRGEFDPQAAFFGILAQDPVLGRVKLIAEPWDIGQPDSHSVGRFPAGWSERNGQPDAPATGDQLARQEAIKQIERKRRFRVRVTLGTVGMIVLAVIWALAEYHNAGGWPTMGSARVRESRTCGTTGSSTPQSPGC